MTRKVVSASFTRPADTNAYTAGDLIANSTTAASVAAMQFELFNGAAAAVATIKRARIVKTGVSVTNPAMRLHLFQSSPLPVVGGDNAALSSKRAGYLGSIDITPGRAFSDGAGGASTEQDITVQFGRTTTGGKKVYGLLEALAAYAPNSAEQFTVTLEAEAHD